MGKIWAGTFFPTLTSVCVNLVQKLGYLGGEKLGWYVIFPPGKWKHQPYPVMNTHTTFAYKLWGKLGRPILSPPPKKQRLHVYSWQGKVGCVFCRRLTICTTVYSHPITFWTRLMFNLVRVGKEWAGPVFTPPLTGNFMFYTYSGQGNWRLAEFFPTPLTICTTIFPTW